jgi:hypothetical protein
MHRVNNVQLRLGHKPPRALVCAFRAYVAVLVPLAALAGELGDRRHCWEEYGNARELSATM